MYAVATTEVKIPGQFQARLKSDARTNYCEAFKQTNWESDLASNPNCLGRPLFAFVSKLENIQLPKSISHMSFLYLDTLYLSLLQVY